VRASATLELDQTHLILLIVVSVECRDLEHDESVTVGARVVLAESKELAATSDYLTTHSSTSG
jgi:hypothetical protein